MKNNKSHSFGIAGLPTTLAGIFILAQVIHGETLPLNQIKLPPGFEINLYANVPNARSMTLSPKGTLFVGTLKEGKVYVVPAQTGGNGSHKAITIADGLNMPNGVPFRNGALYLAEVNRVLRYDDIESHLSNPPKPVAEAVPRG